MKHRIALLAFILSLAACGSGEVIVTIELELDTPDPDGAMSRPLSDIEVQLLPYDRDHVFDSVGSAFADSNRPEPEIPAQLIAAREEVRLAQEEWQTSENRWATIRDTLQTINTEIARYNPAEPRYRELFREYTAFENQLGQVEDRKDNAFRRFTTLQEASIQTSDSVRIQREMWGDEAFASVGDVFLVKEAEAGVAVVFDTTDATGIARGGLRVKPGSYWVHARYELTYTELYWNVPIEVVRGEPILVTLNRANAEERIKL